ncbi:MAG TPA: squalene synthase HpnC [Candidatus Polarisedimenticolia bacterium]
MLPAPETASSAQQVDATPRAARSLREAQAFCADLTRRHYENFPVASWLVPRGLRPAVQSIYAFARIADDFADEPAHEGRRLEKLEEWGGLLERCFAGEAFHPVFVALHESIRRHELPAQPFRDLLAAFRLDVTCHRHADFDSLLRYCHLSANPVGRLILHLFGHREPELLSLSDDFCTALQLTNHWQDVAIDLAKDRIYLPERDRARWGVGEDDLKAGRVSEGFRGLMAEQIARVEERFTAARPLCDEVGGRLRLELRLTWLGGRRVLERIESAGYDVFRRRPKLGPRDAFLVLTRGVVWRS